MGCASSVSQDREREKVYAFADPDVNASHALHAPANFETEVTSECELLHLAMARELPCDSDGDESEEPSEFSRSLTIYKHTVIARFEHKINGDVNQFTPDGTPPSDELAGCIQRVHAWLQTLAESPPASSRQVHVELLSFADSTTTPLDRSARRSSGGDASAMSQLNTPGSGLVCVDVDDHAQTMSTDGQYLHTSMASSLTVLPGSAKRSSVTAYPAAANTFLRPRNVLTRLNLMLLEDECLASRSKLGAAASP